MPDDPYWKSIVNGALSELFDPDNFEQFGTATPDEVAAVFQQMFFDYLDSECAVPSAAYIIGEYKMLAHANIPDGWEVCFGQALDRTTYSELFALIGTTYGAGDGTTTFNIPFFKRRFPVGYEPVPGGDFDLGHTGGEEMHTLTVNEMPSHNHAQRRRSGSGSASNYTTAANASTSQANFETLVTASAGSDEAHENRPPYNPVVMAIYTGVLTA